ncbi:hypothetical protein FQA39_LY03160 [Lamprigera yunnana]|nr:hypothetical protein FQA39_LY03160 [Lamprigera yunnana]
MNEIQDKRHEKEEGLPVKVYEPRNSVLTDLFKESNTKSLYAIIISIFVSLFATTVLHDYIHKNEINLGFRLFRICFRNIHLFAVIWIVGFLSTLLAYYVYKFWAHVQTKFQKSNSPALRLWNYSHLCILLLYYGVVLYCSAFLLITFELGIACSFACTMETIRMVMKVHSFVRTNVPKSLRCKTNKDKQLCPNLSNYLYFLFAPTIVYQDSYPMNKEKTDWKYVSICGLEMLLGMLLLSYIFERGFLPSLRDFGVKPYTTLDIVFVVTQNFPYALLLVFTIFYIGLHVWLNAFAEMLHFSDRLFYKDWWISTTFDRYYRTWNVVVHDWIYCYIYKDFYEHVMPNKTVAKFLAFLISGIFHEYVFCLACGFFMPIVMFQMLVTFLIMEVAKFSNSKFSNLFLFLSYGMGISANITIYIMEYYARINCPVLDSNVSNLDFFVPHLLNCYK